MRNLGRTTGADHVCGGTQIERNQTQLARLQHTNVYNDVFYISSRGHFGTIAGLRLGRTTEHPVEWDEINAALGHTVLLIHILTQVPTRGLVFN